MLRNISWQTFETLLRETGEDRGSRFAYDWHLALTFYRRHSPTARRSTLYGFSSSGLVECGPSMLVSENTGAV